MYFDLLRGCGIKLNCQLSNWSRSADQGQDDIDSQVTKQFQIQRHWKYPWRVRVHVHCLGLCQSDWKSGKE
jgi:hypothetical protein